VSGILVIVLATAALGLAGLALATAAALLG
jgi:hypothetical protein